jgi:hypothetical protein
VIMWEASKPPTPSLEHFLYHPISRMASHGDFKSSSFLHQEIDMVDPQGVKKSVGAVHVQEQATERDVDLAARGC